MNPSLIRLFLLSLCFRRSSTPGSNINSWGRSLLDENHLNILSRGTVSFLNLSYQLWTLFNDMINYSAIAACRSWVPTVTS